MTETRDSAYSSSDDRAGHPPPASPTRAILRLLLLLLTIAAGLWLLYALEGVILLLLLSMLFAYLIAPLVELLCQPVTWGRRPWAIPRPLAIVTVYLSLFASVGVASYVLLPLLAALHQSRPSSSRRSRGHRSNVYPHDPMRRTNWE